MTVDRRTFVGQLATAGLVAASGVGFAQTGPRRIDRVGMQLYTVRSEMEKDVEATLSRIAAIGYKEVEFAGYFEKTPRQIRDMLARHDLTAPSTHIDLTTISTRVAGVIEDSLIIGHKFIVMPYLDDVTRAQPDIYKRVADTLNTVGAAASQAGLQVAYHNHNFEFIPSGGQTGFDILTSSTDPSLVQIELDLCWAVAAGQDPVALFRAHPGRFPMVHVKGLRRKPAAGASAPIAQVLPDVVDVGVAEDIVDWKGIFAQASLGGIEHYFVEHDQPADPFASLQVSYRNLQALRF